MKVTIGQYLNGDTWIYKVDSRVKLIGLVLLITAGFLVPGLAGISAFTAGVLLLLVISGLPIKRVLKAVLPLVMILSITFIFQIFYTKEGAKLTPSYELVFTYYNLAIIIAMVIFYSFTSKYLRGYKILYFLLLMFMIFYVQYIFTSGPVISTYYFEVYEVGLFNALYVMLRLISVVVLSTMLTLTTKPMDLNFAIESVLSPLRVIKFPVSEISMIISIALRQIPTLFIETEKIMKAQASRGVDFEQASFVKKVTQIISILIPMFIISFKKAGDLADAMESRGYVPGEVRTRIHEYNWKRIDTVCMTVMVLVLAAAITTRIIF